MMIVVMMMRRVQGGHKQHSPREVWMRNSFLCLEQDGKWAAIETFIELTGVDSGGPALSYVRMARTWTFRSRDGEVPVVVSR